MPILILLLYALFAATFSLGKVLLNYSPPIFLVGIRMFIAGSLLLAYQLLNGRGKFSFNKAHWWYYCQIILFTTYLPYIFRYFALKHMPSSKACLLYNLSPFVSYVLSYLLFSEKITIKKVIGLSIGFVGFLPTLLSSSCQTATDNSWQLAWPELYILISVTCMSYGWLVVHYLVKTFRYEATMINGISMTCGGFLALITSGLMEQPSTNTVSDFYTFIAILAIVIIVSNLLCHNLYISLLRKYSPTFLSFAAFLSPLFAAFYGWLFLGETISWQFFVTASMVLCGLALFYYDEIGEQEKQALIAELEA
jgi:drug/metabolite transporter (DMT)-like permease